MENTKINAHKKKKKKKGKIHYHIMFLQNDDFSLTFFNQTVLFLFGLGSLGTAFFTNMCQALI